MKRLNKSSPFFITLLLLLTPFTSLRASEISYNQVINTVQESDSQKLQALIDGIPANGGTILISDGIFVIDEILKINNRQNITINLSKYTVLKTNKHGHGILEISNSKNITIQGGKFSGAGNFLDKNYGDGIGGGEKVYTLNQKVNWGHYRNSEYKDLGPHNNGFIGNCGIGILIFNGSEEITIRNVEIEFFNYAGIQVQFIGHSTAIQENYCSNIKLLNNTIHNIYGSGISAHGIKNSKISDNIIFNIGHPDTDGTEIQVNPGYGITMRGVSKVGTHAKNITISNNGIRNCKRAGIDAHSGTDLIINNNTIDTAFITGISMVGKSGERDRVTILENTINNCGNVTGGEGLDAKIGIENTYPNSIIEKNVISNSGYGYAIYNTGSNTTIKQNVIFYFNETGNLYTRAIYLAGKDENKVLNNSIIDNTIHGDINSAIYLNHARNVDIINNQSTLLNKNKSLLILNSKKIKKRKNKSHSF